MRDWVTKIRRRWRWREFRFETVYITPEIFMTATTSDRTDQILITGEETSRWLTMVLIASSPLIVRHGNDTVCWVPLLHQIHLADARAGASKTLGISLPALSFKERSWDFQLPDIVRPLAICSLSDVVVIARRLGMRWKDFRPFDGNLRAEGHFHMITSTNVRSLGTVLQYSYTFKEEWKPTYRLGMIQGFSKEREEIYMPTTGADRLGFEIIRGYTEIHIPHFTLGTQQEIVTALDILDGSRTCAASLRTLIQQYSDYHLRTGDIVAMTMGMARLRGRSHVQVPAPSENTYGFSASPTSRQAFRVCLEKFIADAEYFIRPEIHTVLSACQLLQQT
jgi:hypothetical protein